MPFSIFRLRTLRGADIVALLIGMSLFSMFFFISLYLQQVLGYDALKAGLAYLPLALTIIVSAGVASAARDAHRLQADAHRRACSSIAAGLLWFSQVSAPAARISATCSFPSMLAAVGLGFSFVPVTIAAVTGIRPDEAGLASGLINTAQQVGGALGLAILAAVANAGRPARSASGVRRPRGRADRGLPGRVPGRRRASRSLGAILAAVLISSRDAREHAEAARRGEAAVRGRRLTDRPGTPPAYAGGVPGLWSICVFCGSNPGADPAYRRPPGRRARPRAARHRLVYGGATRRA